MIAKSMSLFYHACTISMVEPKTYMQGYEIEVLFESGKRFRLPAREFVEKEALQPRKAKPLTSARESILDREQFRALQTLEALRVGVVSLQDVETLTIGLETESVSLKRAIERSRDRGGEAMAVIGDYGYGKSHFVELAAKHALRENFLVMNTSLDLVEVPPSKPREIYRTLTKSTRYPDSEERGLKPLLEKAAQQEQIIEILMKISPLGETCPVVVAIQALKYLRYRTQSITNDVIHWISGQFSATYEMRKHLKKPPTLYATGEVARLYSYLLSGLSVLAVELGYNGLVVLIDESEHYSLLKANQRDRADAFFKSMIYACTGEAWINESSIPQHRSVDYPVTFRSHPQLFFLFALTESENRLPIEEWLTPAQTIRLDDRFVERDIRSFMQILGDYHHLAYQYNSPVDEISEQGAAILYRALTQHRINLRELIRTAVTLYDLLYMYQDISPDMLIQEMRDSLYGRSGSTT